MGNKIEQNVCMNLQEYYPLPPRHPEQQISRGPQEMDVNVFRLLANSVENRNQRTCTHVHEEELPFFNFSLGLLHA